MPPRRGSQMIIQGGPPVTIPGRRPGRGEHGGGMRATAVYRGAQAIDGPARSGSLGACLRATRATSRCRATLQSTPPTWTCWRTAGQLDNVILHEMARCWLRHIWEFKSRSGFAQAFMLRTNNDPSSPAGCDEAPFGMSSGVGFSGTGVPGRRPAARPPPTPTAETTGNNELMYRVGSTRGGSQSDESAYGATSSATGASGERPTWRRVSWPRLIRPFGPPQVTTGPIGGPRGISRSLIVVEQTGQR